MHSKEAVQNMPELLEAFRRWMRSVHAGAKTGTLSHRLWCTARTNYSISIPSWDDGQLAECVRTLPQATLRRLEEGLADQDKLFMNVHCWASMSNLNADLAACLRMFER